MESRWCKNLTPMLTYQPASKAHGKQELTLGVRFTAGSAACHFTFLSAYSLIRLSSVKVELCAYWTCKCFWDPITKSPGKKFWGLCAKSRRSTHGSRHGPRQVLPLAGLVVGVRRGAVLTNLHVGVSCLHKAGNVLEISRCNTLAS